MQVMLSLSTSPENMLRPVSAPCLEGLLKLDRIVTRNLRYEKLLGCYQNETPSGFKGGLSRHCIMLGLSR